MPKCDYQMFVRAQKVWWVEAAASHQLIMAYLRLTSMTNYCTNRKITRKLPVLWQIITIVSSLKRNKQNDRQKVKVNEGEETSTVCNSAVVQTQQSSTPLILIIQLFQRKITPSCSPTVKWETEFSVLIILHIETRILYAIQQYS